MGVTSRAVSLLLPSLGFPPARLPFSPSGQQDGFKGCGGSFVIPRPRPRLSRSGLLSAWHLVGTPKMFVNPSVSMKASKQREELFHREDVKAGVNPGGR